MAILHTLSLSDTLVEKAVFAAVPLRLLYVNDLHYHSKV